MERSVRWKSVTAAVTSAAATVPLVSYEERLNKFDIKDNRNYDP